MAPWQGEVEVRERVDLSPDYFLLRFDCPDIAAAARPGQFVNVLVGGRDLCLRRPLSLHDVDGERCTLLIGSSGEGTRWLRGQGAGDRLDVLGPLGGRGLTLAPEARRVALVGGGVGLPPLHFLARRRPADGPQLIVFLGARTQERVLGVQDFERLGCEVRVSTDDGSAGFRGTAVAALEAYLQESQVDQILACGPTPMMRAAAELAERRGTACQVCLEARMACALGACLSCVVETRTPGWTRYQRVCTEGPVFDGCNIVWEHLAPLCAV
jgi:dihydroorotate dehydrogenase electron transfer subunit